MLTNQFGPMILQTIRPSHVYLSSRVAVRRTFHDPLVHLTCVPISFCPARQGRTSINPAFKFYFPFNFFPKKKKKIQMQLLSMYKRYKRIFFFFFYQVLCRLYYLIIRIFENFSRILESIKIFDWIFIWVRMDSWKLFFFNSSKTLIFQNPTLIWFSSCIWLFHWWLFSR